MSVPIENARPNACWWLPGRRLERAALVLGLLLAQGPGVAPSIAEAEAETHVHVVQPGETVQDVAASYGLSTVSILAANAMPNPDLLSVGQSLVIPSVDGVLHTVAPGDTLIRLADRYGVTPQDLVSANTLHGSADDLTVGEVLIVPGVALASRAVAAAATQDAATVSAPHPSPPAHDARASDTYVVRDGDTLRSIAEAFNLDILSVVTMNGLEDPDLIRPGSSLVVSAHPLEHVIEAGDTLGDIAWRYSVDANALLRANGVQDPDRLVTGMTLVVPLGAAPATAPAAHTAAVAPALDSPPVADSAPPAGPPSSNKPAAQTSPPPAPRAAPIDQAPPAASVSITARVTGYAFGAGAVSTRTASGTTTHWGTVAADTHVYPFGTRLRIEGLGDTVFVVEDTGAAVRGNVFDVWFPDAASARRIGAMTRRVTILAPGEA